MYSYLYKVLFCLLPSIHFFHKSIPHLSDVRAHLGNSQNYSLSRPSFKSLKTVKFSLNRPCSFQSSWLVHILSRLLRVSLLLCLTTLTHFNTQIKFHPLCEDILDILITSSSTISCNFSCDFISHCIYLCFTWPAIDM